VSTDFGEQLAFSGLESVGRKKRSSRNSTAGAVKIAEQLPVASVVVERLPIHLDQYFDYLVPAKFADAAVPGALVKVPFGGQQLDGYIVARTESSSHTGRLMPLKSVVSRVSLLSDDSLAFYRRVADYYGGSLADVIRLAIPPRHAATEKAFIERFHADTEPEGGAEGIVGNEVDAENPASSDITDESETASTAGATSGAGLVDWSDLWDDYLAGRAYLDHLTAACVVQASDGEPVSAPRAVWTSLPGWGAPGLVSAAGVGEMDLSSVPHWAAAIASLALLTRAAGKRTLVVVPSAKEVNRVCDALLLAGFVSGHSPEGAASFVTLTYELSAAERYGNYLVAGGGLVDMVVGTRAAAFAPLPEVGLLVCWDDGDESHQDLHAPYPHSREVLSLRSEQYGSALVVGGLGRTLHAQSLLASGWAGEIVAPREVLRVRAPHVVEFGEHEIAQDSGGKNGRLPQRVWRDIRAGLDRGPVLIQVPRAGYVPYVACARCREAAKCTHCHGPLGLDSAGGAPQCRWCGALSGAWACDACGFTGLRAMRIGAERTAEELGRAFPGVPVIYSAARAREGVVETIRPRPSLVIATPGAEPYVPGGYVLGVLLDAHVSSAGSGRYAHQEALERWQQAAGLVRSRHQGGRVYLVGVGAALPTQALVRWDAPGMAERELAERQELHLPPSWRVASISGDRLSVAQFLDALTLPDEAEVLGPVVVDDPDGQTLDDLPYVRAILRVPVRLGRELARAINAMSRIASAKRLGQRISIVLDPKELL
jgi:primosomal protein N' (replication factor Y)